MSRVLLVNRLTKPTDSRRPTPTSRPGPKDKEIAAKLFEQVTAIHDPHGIYPTLKDFNKLSYTWAPAESNYVPFVANDGTGKDEVVDRHAVQLDDVRQGRLDDCYFVAALGAVANLDPKYIEQMIRVDDGARQWVVTLYDVTGQPTEVRVDMSVPVSRDGLDEDPKQGTFAHSYDSALQADGTRVYELWPMIIEKAYAALTAAEDGEELSYSVIKSEYKKVRGGEVIPRDKAAHAFTALMGGGARVPIPATIHEVFGMLRSWCPNPPAENESGPGAGARKPAKPVTVATSVDSGPIPAEIAPRTGENTGLTGHHAYVLRRAMVDVDDPHDAWVTLHNPHGFRHLVQLPIEAFVGSFKDGGRLFKSFVVGAAP